MIITPQNELDAVNEILSSIGSSPVSSLEDDNNVDVINAKRILNGVSLEIQGRGWWFNTLVDVELEPEVEGYGKNREYLVPCPNSYLKYTAHGYKLIRREGYFFDNVTQTMSFPDGIKLDLLIKKLEFNDLPDQARKYITVRSSRIFQMRYLSAEDLDAHLQIEETQALSDMIDYDLEAGQYNIFSDEGYISSGIYRGVDYIWR